MMRQNTVLQNIKKEGVDTSVNSDAIDVEVLLNGEKNNSRNDRHN